MTKLLMCRPDFFSIEYEINPWMDINNNIHHALATEQWLFLYEGLSRIADVALIEPQPGCPDMVFTANAGLVGPDHKHVLLSRFLYSQRQPEEDHFRRWFQERGFEVYQSTWPFEGAGDALYLEDELILAHGFRTRPEVLLEATAFGPAIQVELIDPRFYHLDTCFCPLKNGDYLIYPAAFTPESLAKIRALEGNEIAVIEKEAVKFACNAVLVGDHVALPKGCPITVGELNGFGYYPLEFEMSEFIKSGGACKCLTLAL